LVTLPANWTAYSQIGIQFPFHYEIFGYILSAVQAGISILRCLQVIYGNYVIFAESPGKLPLVTALQAFNVTPCYIFINKNIASTSRAAFINPHLSTPIPNFKLKSTCLFSRNFFSKTIMPENY